MGNIVLVVRKEKIDKEEMNVEMVNLRVVEFKKEEERIKKIGNRNGREIDMKERKEKSLNKRRWGKERLKFIRGFKEKEINIVEIVGREIEEREWKNLIEREEGKREIERKIERINGRRREEKMILRKIGKEEMKKKVDNGENLVNMLGWERMESGMKIKKRGKIGMKMRIGDLGEFEDRLIEGKIGIIKRGERIDIVIKIGNVERIGEMMREVKMEKKKEKKVEKDKRERIENMRKIIKSREEEINEKIIRIDGGKWIISEGKSIIKKKLRSGIRNG